jgi:nucleoside-diphosphate-sugar epimerase
MVQSTFIIENFVMKILIIGGTNFIDPFVVRQLVTMGHDVTLFHRGKSKAELPDNV